MELRHLRYFAAVAKSGSIVGAATTLRIAQPALSRQIRGLEEEIGVPLLDRDRRGAHVTPAGAILADEIEPLFARIARAIARSRLAHEGRLGAIRLGLGSAALGNNLVSHGIAAIHERFPEVDLLVSELGSYVHSDALLANEIDLAIGLHGAVDERLIGRETLSDDPIDCAMISTCHPLAASQLIQIDELRGDRLIILDPASARGIPEFYEALAEANLTAAEVHPTIESSYMRIAAGLGWAPVMRSMVRHGPPGCTIVPLAGFSVPSRLIMSWRAHDRSPLVANVRAVIRDIAARRDAAAPRSTLGMTPEPSVSCASSTPPGLELRHLRALIAATEDASLGRAARRLQLTQSGLSRQIRTLEQELGMPLLRRVANGVAATPAGNVLRGEATMILATVETMVSRAQHIHDGIIGTCRIGSVAAEFTGELLPGILRDMRERWPNVAIELREMLTSHQIDALRDGRIDVAVAAACLDLDDDPAINGVRLGEDPIECALLAESHPLAARTWLTAQDLATEPFLFISRATLPRLYDSVISAFEQIGLVPLIKGSFNGSRVLLRLAADGVGWTIGSRLQRTKPLPGLVAVPIEGLHVPAGLQLLWRRDETDPCVRELLEAFRRGS